MSATLELLRAAQEGDRDACERAVIENNGLIWSVVRRYYGRGVDPEDLYQLGCLGFLKAVQGFDFDYGTCFSTYAVPKIAGEIRRFLRDDGAVKVGRTMREQAQSLYTIRERLRQTLGREPVLSELSEASGLTPEEIAQVEIATDTPESLQRETADGLTLEGMLGTEAPEEGMVERIALRESIDQLPEKERMAILLRYFKGLTQEQVAQALGVSGPAVNKWERGACCPDLALLAPLARLLDTDLNTLLSFREELTGAEIAAFTEELYTLAQSRGIDAAFLRAEELLHRWPGCDRLTISLAMTLNGLFFTLGVAEPEPYERRLEPLYRALADSEEPDIRDQALHLLIGRHMRREEYAAAEELLSSLSDRWPHRDALQAGLLRRTGRGEEAAELWERRLLNAATEVYESLVSLQELALQAERLEDGARLAALIEETVERYALIPGVASSGRLQQAAAEGDKTAALSALRDMLEALNRSWDGGGLYPHLLPGTQVAVGSVLLPGLLLELQREPELAFLQDEPEFQALLKRYGGGTH